MPNYLLELYVKGELIIERDFIKNIESILLNDNILKLSNVYPPINLNQENNHEIRRIYVFHSESDFRRYKRVIAKHLDGFKAKGLEYKVDKLKKFDDALSDLKRKILSKLPKLS